jgi:hypothetical protein
VKARRQFAVVPPDRQLVDEISVAMYAGSLSDPAFAGLIWIGSWQFSSVNASE